MYSKKTNVSKSISIVFLPHISHWENSNKYKPLWLPYKKIAAVNAVQNPYSTTIMSKITFIWTILFTFI